MTDYDDMLSDPAPPEVVPLRSTTEVPPYPVDSLPHPLVDMVKGVAVATQTDPAMAATLALTAVAACVGGCDIEVRKGWVEPLSVFAVCVASPGERKSGVAKEMTGAIGTAEQEMIEKAIPIRREQLARKDIADRRAEKAKKAAADGEGDDLISDALSAVEKADEITVDPLPRLRSDDATPEALASLLAEQGGRISVLSTEGGPFDIMAGRYSANVPNIDVYLKGHAGDPIRIDRKGRPPEHIERPVLTVGLMIQPKVLSDIAANGSFRGRGLLARFLYCLPVSHVGNRRINPGAVSDSVRANYNSRIDNLAKGLYQKTAELTLTPEARAEMIDLETEVEPTLATDGELGGLRDWGSKYVGAVARLAGILHLAELGTEGLSQPVTLSRVKQARVIGEYYRKAAINAFVEMSTDQDTADALYMLKRIRLHVERTGSSVLSERDIYKASRHFRTVTDMKPALKRLVAHGYLRAIPTTVDDDAAPGRPKSPEYEFHDET